MPTFLFPGKVIRDKAKLLAHLRASGFPVDGVGSDDQGLYVFTPKGEKKDPSSAVNTYVPPDYYEIVGNRPPIGESPGSKWAIYSLKADGLDTVTFTVTKKNGKTGATKPDSEQVNIEWHGAREIYVSGATANLVNGVGTFEVGRARQVGGGSFVEVSHPEEKADRAYVKVEVK